MPWRVSVRGYFLAIVSFALLAALVLVIDLAAQQRRQLRAAAGHDAVQLARLAAGAHERTVSETERTLELLARMPAVRSGEGCAALLAELRRRMPRYLDLGVARQDGEVTCSAAAVRRSVGDRAWFRSAAEWRQLGVGEYHLERGTGRAAVTVALPLLDHRGRMSAVVFAVVDLTWLGELFALADLPPEATLALVDRDGFVLARHPAADPTRLDGKLLDALGRVPTGVLESDALDGGTRLLGFTRVGPADGGGALVVVAVPTPSMAAIGRALADGVAWIALIAVLGLVAAVIGSEMLLRRRIEHLVATTRRLAAGDFAARTGWQDTGSELGQVAQAFDEMAGAVERLTGRTQLILEAVSEAIVGVDAEERVTFVNPVAATLLGVPGTDLVGRPLHGLLREATGATGERCPLCEAIDSGAVQQSGDGLLARPDGAVVPVEYTCTPKRERGRAAGAVVALKDISRRKRAEQDRQRRRDSLHQRDKLASMATLLADVAHELNNPLTVIIAGSTLLRDATRDEGVRRRAELLEQAAERCALTIRNFLALVRQYPATREEVPLERIVKETLGLVTYQLEVDEISVDIALERETPPVWADPHQLHQVLLNLVTNARHALRATAPPRRLSIALRHDEAARRVVLEVADSGPGVPPELRGFVFRPFFTTKSPEEGTGLGLALCHDIVAAHGGTIRVDSAPGGGALFVVELPLERSEDVVAPPVPATVQPPRHGRVLVVDDDVELANVLAAALRAVGHQVETAANGLEALTALERGRFDVILTDVRMPKLDGPGLYREILQRHPDLVDRVVFLTGDILGRETAAFLERTRAAHLTKPFDITQVRRVVADVLDR